MSESSKIRIDGLVVAIIAALASIAAVMGTIYIATTGSFDAKRNTEFQYVQLAISILAAGVDENSDMVRKWAAKLLVETSPTKYIDEEGIISKSDLVQAFIDGKLVTQSHDLKFDPLTGATLNAMENSKLLKCLGQQHNDVKLSADSENKIRHFLGLSADDRLDKSVLKIFLSKKC